MRMLLTGQGISNDLIRTTLLDLLGKPLSESRVVMVIDAILPFPGDRTKLVEHLTQTHSLGWAEFDVLSLFAGPPSLVESRLAFLRGGKPSVTRTTRTSPPRRARPGPAFPVRQVNGTEDQQLHWDDQGPCSARGPDLGFRGGAGDENRTRTISLGS